MKVKTICALLACVMGLSACSHKDISVWETQQQNEAVKTVYAMDTAMILKAYGENAEPALQDAENEIMRLDHLFRRGNDDSEVYQVNTKGVAEVSVDTAAVVETALKIGASTDGAFDISIAPVMDLWGFYNGEFHVPSDEELSDKLAVIDYRNISVRGKTVSVSNGSQIDLGGIAKGYLSSRIVDILQKDGISSGIISLGGNVQTFGAKPDGSKWKVAIQDPDDDDGYIGVLSISDMAVITSGGYQRFFEQGGNIYHHIIDPSTGSPARSGLRSVSIVSGDGTLADGLSTALYVMGLDKGAEYWRDHEGFDVIFVTDDNEILITGGLKDIFESPFEYSVIE